MDAQLEKSEILRQAKNAKKVRHESMLEATFALHLRARRFPECVREYEFHPTRGWRFDFAWPNLKIAVEVEGEVHRIKNRFDGDLEKYAAALLMGWRVLRVGSAQVRSAVAIQWIANLLGHEIDPLQSKSYFSRQKMAGARQDSL